MSTLSVPLFAVFAVAPTGLTGCQLLEAAPAVTDTSWFGIRLSSATSSFSRACFERRPTVAAIGSANLGPTARWIKSSSSCLTTEQDPCLTSWFSKLFVWGRTPPSGGPMRRRRATISPPAGRTMARTSAALRRHMSGVAVGWPTPGQRQRMRTSTARCESPRSRLCWSVGSSTSPHRRSHDEGTLALSAEGQEVVLPGIGTPEPSLPCNQKPAAG